MIPKAPIKKKSPISTLETLASKETTALRPAPTRYSSA